MRALALRVGGRTLTILEYLGGLSRLGWQALVQGLRPPYDLFVLLRQIDLVGVRSLGIIGIAAVFTGLVLALFQSSGPMPQRERRPRKARAARKSAPRSRSKARGGRKGRRGR